MTVKFEPKPLVKWMTGYTILVMIVLTLFKDMLPRILIALLYSSALTCLIFLIFNTHLFYTEQKDAA